MNFAVKIDKILKTNKLGVNSPSGLEEFIGAGRGAISTPYREGTEPGTKTQKKIVDKLRINPDWWDTGKGEIYLPENGLNEPAQKYEPAGNPDLNLLFIDTINRLIEKNDKLVQDKNGEIVHLRGNENWFKQELSKLTSKLGTSKDS